MTTEAEEFKRQEERFTGFAWRFSKIHNLDMPIQYAIIPSDYGQAFNAVVYDGEKHLTRFNALGTINFKTKLDCLKAINHDLRLIVEGKVKGE